MRFLPSAWAALLVCCGLAVFARAADAPTQPPGQPPVRGVRLRYTFQPDCFRASLTGACDTISGRGLNLGPQIAVWLEKADRSEFVSDLMVTNLTAVRGIGNRPGYWKFPSTWRFPYGKRKMALPVWAHARGRLYDTVMMQDDGPTRAARWASVSTSRSPPPTPTTACRSCRRSGCWRPDGRRHHLPDGGLQQLQGSPREHREVALPAAQRPGGVLRPRLRRGRNQPGQCPVAMKSATRYAEINDLDLVAAATPVLARVQRGLERARGAGRGRLRADAGDQQGVRHQRHPFVQVVRRYQAARRRLHRQLRPALGGIPRPHRDQPLGGAAGGGAGHRGLRRLGWRHRRAAPRRRHHQRHAGIGARPPHRDRATRPRRRRAGDGARARRHRGGRRPHAL